MPFQKDNPWRFKKGNPGGPGRRPSPIGRKVRQMVKEDPSLVEDVANAIFEMARQRDPKALGHLRTLLQIEGSLTDPGEAAAAGDQPRIVVVPDSEYQKMKAAEEAAEQEEASDDE